PDTSYGKKYRSSGSQLRDRKYRRRADWIFGRGGRARPGLAMAAGIVGRRLGRRCDRGALRQPVLDRIAARPGRGSRSAAPVAANPVGREGKPERNPAAGV